MIGGAIVLSLIVIVVGAMLVGPEKLWTPPPRARLPTAPISRADLKALGWILLGIGALVLVSWLTHTALSAPTGLP